MEISTLLIYIMFGIIVFLYILQKINNRKINFDNIDLKKENVACPKDHNFFLVRTIWMPTGLSTIVNKDNYKSYWFYEYYHFVSISFGTLYFPLYPIKSYWLMSGSLSYIRSGHTLVLSGPYSSNTYYIASGFNFHYSGSLFRILPLFKNWAWLGLLIAVINWIVNFS